jgi:uncharacterized repeat protein (TIGR01451 family)
MKGKRTCLLLFSLLVNCYAFSDIQVYEINGSYSTDVYYQNNGFPISVLIPIQFLGEDIVFSTYVNGLTITDDIIDGPQRNIGILSNSNQNPEIKFICLPNVTLYGNAKVFEDGEVISSETIYDQPFARLLWEHFEDGATWPSAPVAGDALGCGYLGFYINIAGSNHYGWIEFMMGCPNQDLEVIRIAIESTPETPIFAGEVNSPIGSGPFNITGNAFVDDNSNGILDSGENLFDQAILDIGIGMTTYINYQVSNPFNVNASQGTYTISPNYNTDLWSLTTTDSYTVDLDALNPTASGIDFGYSPIGTVEAVSASINAQLARCSEVRTHTINLNNDGNTLVNGTMVYTFDELCSYVDCFPMPDSVSGNNIYFSFADLNYYESLAFQVNLMMPDAGSAGEFMDFFLTVRNEAGIEIANGYVSSMVSCSYDPNDITEFKGWTENGFFLAGDRLEYLIRFQNTGNDTAYNVFLVDQLPAGFDFESLHAIAWSHPCQSYLTTDGQLNVLFENIFLPDSGANELASHGFFRFSIATEESLTEGDVLENSVDIYFDSNPAVITNVALNSVFACEGLAEFSTSEELCLGEEFMATSTQEWISEYQWQLNGEEISTENTFTLIPENSGEYEVQLSASNPLCVEEETALFQVLQIEWVEVVQNNEMLYANTFSPGPFTWYFNGSIIPSAEGASYTPEVNGTYHVTVMGLNGCIAVSNELEFVISGLAELNSEDLLISPNPVVDVLNIQLQHWNSKPFQVQLIDQSGRLVSSEQFSSSACTFSREGISAGSYELRILSAGDGEVLMHRKVVLE